MGAKVWAVIALAGFLAQPAWSNGGAALRGNAPLQTSAATLIGAGPHAGSSRVQTLRIRLDKTTPWKAHEIQAITPLRRRLANPMLEYYPAGEGFHLSAGGRFDMRAKAARGVSKLGSLIYAPTGMFGRGRKGLKRFTPAAALGYGYALDQAMTLELEGGARVEPDDPSMREFARFARRGSRGAGRFGSSGGVNPLVQLSFGYKF